MYTCFVPYITNQKPAHAQFGVPQQRKKGGGTFEELNQMAKETMGGKGVGGAGDIMGQLANMDPDEMMRMVQDSMNDPATKEYLEQFGAGMGDVMEQLAAMSPEDMKKQIVSTSIYYFSDFVVFNLMLFILI